MDLGTLPVATRILIVDDHAMVCCALRLLIQRYSGFKVIGEASNSAEALASVRQEPPDIILLDLDLGNESGLDLLPLLLREAPEARVIVLTGLYDTEIQQKAILNGAIGLVSKEKSVDVLMKALEKVKEGEVWLDRSTMAKLLGELSFVGRAKEKNIEADRISTLTPREKEIIPLVAEGLRNRQIAQHLHISEATARHHLTSVFSKLSIRNRFELIIFAYRHGLITAVGRQGATDTPASNSSESGKAARAFHASDRQKD